MTKHRAYNLQHIRPLEVRPLTNPESVQKPWGILISEPQARRGQP
jgi:hypothetical protein